ncbi:MAG: hypothetical protein GWN01_01825 [Nitrosopumilaceae archaeon]|nr:hypothetical protein [Nitrosopumilaceae archaeon]NIT99711.1 hypothetical protein [Nitrosopumilaceae archaeon]NIU88572.1 hypothetical protein [Nitrosopumilaceae archaeon]NIV64846.1 hypothetical protein [Nitrosopumilaceae archaeon]NIX60314.1 hypothetical protein [Nitrosopumilaceae archaeon]
MASVLQHEFGHALGMSHYVSDNPHLTQQWYDNFGIGAPSIMTRQPANEEMKKITSIDIDLIRKIYSSNGFGKKSAFVPVFYEPEPKPDSIHDEFSSKKSKIIITPRNTKMFTISGNVPEDIYRRGIPAEIQIIYPDSTKETHGIPVSKHQHYEYPLKFNYDSQSGNYKVLVQFNHKLIQELTLNVKKESTSKIYNGDVDGDGFPDEKDACPDEYGSHKYSEGCPTFPPRPDKDSDGIPDKWDDCPTASGLEDRNGCPVHIPKPDKDGDGIPDGKDSCPTIAGIIQNSLRLNGCPDTPSSEITKKQSWDSTKQEMWTKVSQQYEILSEVKLKSLEAKEKLELAKLTLENNKKTISKVQSNQDLERFQDTVYNRFENFEKLISEAKELERKSDVLPIKNKAYNEFQTLKNGLQQAENALTQLNPNNKKATEKVNQAWDLLKINKQKLNSLESRLNVADNNLASGNYELAKQFYTFDPDYNRIFGKNLIKISELIEDANNNQSTCFLFWCW